MKKIKIISKISILSILVGLMFAGCEKKVDNIFSEYELVDQNVNAFIKINYNVAFFSNPGVQLKVNGTRVSGLLNTRYPFPGGGFNTLGGSTGDYLPVTPGSTAIALTIPKRGTLIDSVDIFKTDISTVAGKRYSLHVADTVATKSLLVEENSELADSGFVRMRFVNLIPNVAGVDLYNNTTKIASASNIPFMGISEPFTLPIGVATSTIWNIRVGGSAPTSTVLATYTLTANVQSRRVYTAFASGWSGRTETSRRPYISFFYVR
jgi:Domain of unknown function (DUF4397)